MVCTSVFIICFDMKNRKIWGPMLQELFLMNYFIVYSKFQHNIGLPVYTSYFDMMYFAGLSVSVLGFIFELVNEKKRDWIPSEAWEFNERNEKNQQQFDDYGHDQK